MNMFEGLARHVFKEVKGNHLTIASVPSLSSLRLYYPLLLSLFDGTFEMKIEIVFIENTAPSLKLFSGPSDSNFPS